MQAYTEKIENHSSKPYNIKMLCGSHNTLHRGSGKKKNKSGGNQIEKTETVLNGSSYFYLQNKI